HAGGFPDVNVAAGALPAVRPRVPARRGLRHLAGRFARNRLALAGLAVFGTVLVIAIAAPWVAPYSPIKTDFSSYLRPPDARHLLGTDELGRDVLSRILFGSRASLEAGVISVGLGISAGVPLGLAAGFYGGRLDDVLMRLTDAMLSFPPLILALAVAAVLGVGLAKVMIAIAVVLAPVFMRIMRAQVLSERGREYIQAARAMGAADRRIIWRHLLPNSVAPIVVQGSLNVAGAILTEATLSFLGLGTQPPTPSWGSMLNAAQQYLTQAPWLSIWPGVAIAVTVFAVNVAGDGIREIWDPRTR
ncbi:MAG TPA: ABC transporter permease, partial [bacterium]|nr:ABC transporter permease [bacterium]